MMKPGEVKKALANIGITTPVKGAYLFQTQPITIRRWGASGTTGSNAILLRLLVAGKITVKDIEAAHD